MGLCNLRRLVGVCVLLVLARTGSPARAELLTVSASRDNTIFQSDVSNSLGGGVIVYAGKNNQNSVRRALIGFDLSAIPAGSQVASVQLHFVLQGVSGGGGNPPDSVPRTIGLHRLLGDWGEGTGGAGQGTGGTGRGFPTVAGEHPSTWNHQFYDNDLWTTAGGDFAAAASATTIVGTAPGDAYTWGSTAAMVADVQGWVDNPSTSFGWLVRGDESASGTFRTFWSTEADPVLQGPPPQLVIQYAPSVPEPSSLAALLGGAVVGLLIIRRRTKPPGGKGCPLQ